MTPLNDPQAGRNPPPFAGRSSVRDAVQGPPPDRDACGMMALQGDVPSARRRGSRDNESVTPVGGAQYYGRTEEKDLTLAARHAPEPRGVTARGARRMRELWGAEAPPPCVQPLRLLRWARGGGSRQGSKGRDSRLTPDGARADVV